MNVQPMCWKIRELNYYRKRSASTRRWRRVEAASAPRYPMGKQALDYQKFQNSKEGGFIPIFFTHQATDVSVIQGNFNHPHASVQGLDDHFH